MDRLSFIEAAYQILKREGKPLSAEQITSIALAENLIYTRGQTPSLTMSAGIYVDIDRKGENSRFVKVDRGKFYLREAGKLAKVVAEPTLPILPIVQESIHESLKRKIKEIGSILGRYAKEEYQAHPYVYDVVWKVIEGLPRPCHVFEVQDKGAVDGALAKLQHARDMWKPKLFLVITGEKDRKKVDMLLRPFLEGTFHEISRDTTVLTSEMIDEIHKALSAHKEVVRQFLEV